ncbi:flagellar basal body P-ring protein FlgI [bacterium]|nr:flagellar basal body P-ring protein FlgI [bacterium]
MTFLRRVFILSLSFLTLPSFAMRLKDVVSVKGVRENQLVGYGLVVGLKGSGDSKSEYTGMSMSQMLRQMGVDVKSDLTFSKNVAAVVVTADLPPFARVGARVDIIVSSIGDAKSLEGGTLLLTPLRASDKKVYVVGQGPLSVGGFAGSGGGSSSSKNHPTIGRVPDGGLVEREVSQDFTNRSAVRLTLHNPDFTTSSRISRLINQELGGVYARSRDAATVDVMIPYDFEGSVVDLMARIERLPVQNDNSARIVINERTGTIVVGEAVRISTVAIAHGNLTLEIKSEEKTVEEPVLVAAEQGPVPNQPVLGKKTTTVNETTVKFNEEGDKLLTVPEGATLGDVVKGLNTLGVTPRDLISILQALKAQGALQAELEIL